MSRELSYVIIGGFNSSGSSAVIDLLKEFRCTYDCGSEIRFITDPYGIRALENSLTEQWDPVLSAGAIDDFLHMCEIACRRKSYFPLAPYGQGYIQKINPRFMDITRRYIARLSDHKYYGDYYHFKSKKNYICYVLDRCRYAVEYYSHGRLRTANRKKKPYYFAHPSKERFYKATKAYFRELFDQDNTRNKRIILDQALTFNTAGYLNKYFSNAKMIIVDRDPRDIFADCVFHDIIFEDKNNSRQFGHDYAKRQLALRENREENEDIMYIYFEDLIYNYDETKEKIMNFLELAESEHAFPRRYFNPDVSIKNVNLWKKCYKKYNCVIDALAEDMSEYLYIGKRGKK